MTARPLQSRSRQSCGGGCWGSVFFEAPREFEVAVLCSAHATFGITHVRPSDQPVLKVEGKMEPLILIPVGVDEVTWVGPRSKGLRPRPLADPYEGVAEG